MFAPSVRLSPVSRLARPACLPCGLARDDRTVSGYTSELPVLRKFSTLLSRKSLEPWWSSLDLPPAVHGFTTFSYAQQLLQGVTFYCSGIFNVETLSVLL
ncbi:hypothetical protein ElyMa_005375300 [Elysia marginata]|uniref:Uncharacterized protein n=1 Tax=Elysia marginata TaxID=1093978 RepID=A0AAV4EDD5_9GAST|nr:hypothetical protein ElyMa_005375300 [Elysia marginata]